MKKSIKYIILFLLFAFISYSQKNIDKPPAFPPKGGIKKPKKLSRLFNYLNINELNQLDSDIYCWKIDNECYVLDGKTVLYSNYQTSGNDNPFLVPYTYAEGEFLEGKYQGVWKYYDKNKNVIKKEKWDNGKLIYRKEHDFNTCDNLEDYRFSNINMSVYNSIEQFKKDFLLKSGKLACKNGIIKRMRLVFHDETTTQFIYINDGYITGHQIQVINDRVPSGKSYTYDKVGNVKAISEVKNELTKGNGHYINYYYSKNINNIGIITTPILKSEGEIKNNFKFGEWKYYNKEGKIDSTKTYTLKDSVDVRFPHCIFNKMEPCY
jgi:antitoxin component YwqK of YwqJK toxin-antitoxin module